MTETVITVADILQVLEKVGLQLKRLDATDTQKAGWAFIWTPTGQRGYGYENEAEAIVAAISCPLKSVGFWPCGRCSRL